jgi:hypothetical protein
MAFIHLGDSLIPAMQPALVCDGSTLTGTLCVNSYTHSMGSKLTYLVSTEKYLGFVAIRAGVVFGVLLWNANLTCN